jgi:ribonuclease HI
MLSNRTNDTHPSLGDMMGWFDGTTQKHGQLSNAGGAIRCTDHLSYKWTFNCGEGTNTRAKLLGVWDTLIVASRLDLKHIKVLGDSQIIIDWLNNKGKLRVLALDRWQEKIIDFIKNFKEISFEHIFR